MGEGLWALSEVDNSARARVAFPVWLPFVEAVLKGFLMVFGLQGAGGWRVYGLCPKLGDAARTPRIPSMISICGGSPEGFFNGSCGNYGPFLAWDGPFRDVCVWRWLMNFVQSRELGERAFHLPRFILAGSFSYTLYLRFRF